MLSFLFHLFSWVAPSDVPSRGVLFFYSFDARADHVDWTVTSLPNYTGKWRVRTPPQPTTDTFERLLFMSTPSAYSAISTVLSPPISPNSETFIIQYEVRAAHNLTYSGAYLKLFSQPNFDPSTLSNETRHSFMFGPDVCADKKRLTFYFYHVDPATGKTVEKGLVGTSQVAKDDLNHLYTLILRRNGSLTLYIDGIIAQSMLFNNSFVPPIVPPVRIPDPSVSRPCPARPTGTTASSSRTSQFRSQFLRTSPLFQTPPNSTLRPVGCSTSLRFCQMGWP